MLTTYKRISRRGAIFRREHDVGVRQKGGLVREYVFGEGRLKAGGIIVA